MEEVLAEVRPDAVGAVLQCVLRASSTAARETYAAVPIGTPTAMTPRSSSGVGVRSTKTGTAWTSSRRARSEHGRQLGRLRAAVEDRALQRDGIGRLARVGPQAGRSARPGPGRASAVRLPAAISSVGAARCTSS